MDKKMRSPRRLMIHILLVIGAALMILPFFWMLLTSFKSVTESTSMNPFVFFPSQWRWGNYIEVLRQNNFPRLYWNTFAMVVLRVICSIVFSAMAAYAFARLKFPGRGFSLDSFFFK